LARAFSLPLRAYTHEVLQCRYHQHEALIMFEQMWLKLATMPLARLSHSGIAPPKFCSELDCTHPLWMCGVLDAFSLSFVHGGHCVPEIQRSISCFASFVCSALPMTSCGRASLSCSTSSLPFLVGAATLTR
jgi:hypothetical protein